MQCRRPARRRDAERHPGVGDDLLAHQPVADAADHGADADGQQLAERDRAALERVLLDEELAAAANSAATPQAAAATPRRRPARRRWSGPVRSGRRSACLLSSPTSTASTSARRRSRCSAGMPCTSATASTNTAVASRNTTVSPATADMRHQRADAGEGRRGADGRAAGHHRGEVVLLQLARRSRRASRRDCVAQPLDVGLDRGPCTRAPRSMIWDSARAAALGIVVEPWPGTWLLALDRALMVRPPCDGRNRCLQANGLSTNSGDRLCPARTTADGDGGHRVALGRKY